MMPETTWEEVAEEIFTDCAKATLNADGCLLAWKLGLSAFLTRLELKEE